MTQLMNQHGGDLDAIEQKYHIPKAEIVDFSGNINPLGFPESVKKALAEHLDIISTYPDKRYRALRESIAAYTGANPDHVTVGNGSTELISVFIQSVSPRRSIILGPAYSEYERELTVCQSQYTYFPLKEEDGFLIDLPALLAALTDEIDLFVACNPNNPTGTAITTQQMRQILTHCQAHHISVMVDETYIEFSDQLDEICSIPLVAEFDNLFVIRGVSKFFAAPGLRLGYGITSSQAFHSLLIAHQDPWSVNSLAAFAGEQLFQDHDFIAKTKHLISSERQKAMDTLATFHNLKAYPSSSNFILLHLLTKKITAAQILEACIQKKFLIRDASSFHFLDSSYLRFCILSPEHNAALLALLKDLVE